MLFQPQTSITFSFSPRQHYYWQQRKHPTKCPMGNTVEQQIELHGAEMGGGDSPHFISAKLIASVVVEKNMSVLFQGVNY